MPGPLHVYLDEPDLTEARRGHHTFLNRVAAAVAPHGLRLALHAQSPAERIRGLRRKGWSLHHMSGAAGPRGLTFRRVYVGPFWQIDRAEERWLWATAQSVFRPEEVDPGEAAQFAARWRNRLYSSPMPPEQGGDFVLVPLQGRLSEQRSFQAMSPIAMLREVLARLPGQRILATLHPRETYSAGELAELGDLERVSPGFHLAKAPTSDLLPQCRAVITQNSAVALSGYFLHKPAVLFARSDFHHIALSVPHIGLERAFGGLATHRPDYDRYLWWFLQHMSLNAGRDDVAARIAATLRRCGMPI